MREGEGEGESRSDRSLLTASASGVDSLSGVDIAAAIVTQVIDDCEGGDGGDCGDCGVASAGGVGGGKW